jgi:CheY-like chemotaxis protein
VTRSALVPGETQTRRPRVLVIDDNRDAADTLILLLTVFGFQSQAVYDGIAAIKAAESFLPDCILSDLNLPGLDGYQLAEKFREHDWFQRTPLIALSATPDEDRARSAGFDHCFSKPVAAEVLVELLSRMTAMSTQLNKAEDVVRQQGAVVHEVRDLVREVKEDVKDIKGGLQQDVKELKQELREVKEDVREIKEELREAKEDDGE